MPVTVWKGQLTFGLVSIPIRIIRAAREERVRFRQVYAPAESEMEKAPPLEAGHSGKVQSMPAKTARGAAPESEPAAINVAPVHRTFAAEDTGESVAPGNVLKGYEYSKGQFAVFHPEEIRRLRAETTREMEIVQFVKLSGIDPIYFNASYYVAPDSGGDKPYSLLFEAMRRTGLAAVARFAMHGRERIPVLRPGKRGIVMNTLFFEREIHSEDEFAAGVSLVTSQEMKLAELLISHLSGEFDPSAFQDERTARIRQSVEAKIAASPAPAAPSAQATAPDVNILDALRRSLGKKPAATETRGGKTTKRQKSGA